MKRLFLGAVFTLALALAIPAAASAAEYETYVGCGASGSTPPAGTCLLGDTVGAFFEADEETEYEVCVEFPDGVEECAEEQEAEAEALYVNELVPDEIGTYFFSWYVGVTEVGTATLRLDPRPAPPAPPVLPPAPAPVSLPIAAAPAPVKSVACTKAEKRVKQLKNQLRNTSGREAKAKVRGKLKGAKAAVNRAC
jgi:hypothetical protein